LLALLAGSLFFSRLDLPLLEPEEARYAEIPRQMLAEGRLVVPVLHGRPYCDKPPLLYWLVMGCYRVFGPHDWAARLVPGAAGTLTVLLLYAWGRRALGPRAGLLGALILCLSPRFVYLARNLGLDGLLCLAVTASLLAARVATAGPGLRRRWWLLSAAASGVGLLAKGPVALALAVPPVLAWSWRGRGGCRPSARAWLAYLAVAAALAGPWYAALAGVEPGAAADFFWRHHVVRFVEPFDHAKPAWFYVPGLLGGLLPAAALMPLAWLRARRRCPGAAGEAGFFLWAGLWCFLFFSASGCKRAVYLLPALPPLALFLGRCLDLAVPRAAGRHLRLARAGGVLTAFALTFAWVWLLLPAHHRGYTLRALVRRAAGSRPDLPVLCYPRRWDSISFYLGRQDVRAYEADRLGALAADLAASPETLLFVKDGGSLNELRRALPAGVELTAGGPWAGVVAARTRRAQGGS
jgi:4-amino-4-deoxy-L-arabinose transferase-like glycosyltransferase